MGTLAGCLYGQRNQTVLLQCGVQVPDRHDAAVLGYASSFFYCVNSFVQSRTDRVLLTVSILIATIGQAAHNFVCVETSRLFLALQ